MTFIYPELRPETRTVPRAHRAAQSGRAAEDRHVRRRRVPAPAPSEAPVTAVPDSAVIDSGTRQVVLVAKGEGRFEPRPVKLGRRGDGYVEVVEGLEAGEEVVTTATFLIDAESNLQSRAARPSTEQEPPQ